MFRSSTVHLRETMQNVFVGNISATTTEHDIRAMFEPYGQVLTVKVVTDRDSGTPRGFAFVEMSSDADAKKAISALDGTIHDEHRLRVNEARPKDTDGKSFEEGMRSHRRHRY